MRTLMWYLMAILGLTSCYKNTTPVAETGDLKVYGTGQYAYDLPQGFASTAMQVYYHIPDGADANSPVLMVFHGNLRDARESRNEMINMANQKKCVLLVPEFSEMAFPGNNEYHLGGVFDDGENPTAGELRSSNRWTFSLVKPLFEEAKTRFGYVAHKFDAFGHSAGAQFLHRLLYFESQLPLNRAFANASGWYTLPNVAIDYPYGLGQTGLNEAQTLERVFGHSVHITVGALDNDPNAPALRRNAEADVQGTNRRDRAQYFYQYSAGQANALGLPFSSWTFSVIPGIGHDFVPAAQYAINTLYPQ